MNSFNIIDIARKAMLERNFEVDFSKSVESELQNINEPFQWSSIPSVKDLRKNFWFSIDNDDSQDLDQLTFAEALPNDSAKIYIAIADVTSTVKKDTAIDTHAKRNTTSVYPPGMMFPMLPLKLSTNLTSLNANQDRLAIVVEIMVNKDGSIGNSDVYPAAVHNYAKLAYISTGAWLDNPNTPFQPVDTIQGLRAQLQLQDSIAQKLKKYRHEQGMLTLQTIESKAVLSDHSVVKLVEVKKNRANELIEHFMIAANTATTQYLQRKGMPVVRRIVRTPKKWDRIVEIATELGDSLPEQPDAIALQQFLIRQKKKDPLRFVDLSLAVIKLIGRGEYVIQLPGEQPIPHFGLSLKQYSHTTAPNRRYPDIITQRLIHYTFENNEVPYTLKELYFLADHCSVKESDADKVERRVQKSAAAMLLANRINDTFDGIITGASVKGTWVRIFDPPVEGKVVEGFHGLDVGHRVKVKLLSVDVPQGFIDFQCIKIERN